ncbi:Hypothetical predicted protein [Octopus vulgaris]|uniref:Uncharacterized protein n=1 Tax=Octopus vulgaris TaxID=6645 RepID=A0AA36B4I3_OCTVU|nr:Hypothetical predicted protein [Octopus vulgaris]
MAGNKSHFYRVTELCEDDVKGMSSLSVEILKSKTIEKFLNLQHGSTKMVIHVKGMKLLINCDSDILTEKWYVAKRIPAFKSKERS